MMPLRRFTPAEVRTGRRRLELSLLLTVFLAMAMFALAEGHVLFAAISAGVIVAHALAAWRHAEIHAHRAVLNGGVLAVSAVLLVRYLTSEEDLLIALGHYVTLIQVCKLFERKKDRDYVQLLVMSLLLVLAGAMICQELLFALLGLGYGIGLCYVAMALTVRRSFVAAMGQETSFAASAAAVKHCWPAGALKSRLAVAAAVMLASGIVVFLVAPRGTGGAALPLRRTPREGVSGFAETVRLGEPRSIYLSDRVVMHVRLVSPDGAVLGPSGTLYLRGRVFDEYADSRWVVPPRRYQIFPPRASRPILDLAVRQEVSMVPSLLPTAFATYPALAVSSPDATVRTFDNLEYGLKRRANLDRPVRYVAQVLMGSRSARALRHLRGVSGRRGYPDHARMEVSSRVESLARRWCADLLAARRRRTDVRAGEQDLAIARRLAARLKQRCTYTLDLTEADSDRDAVEDFLFHLRRGHCEYFASALTVMCQALDVRARLATGFAAHDYDGGMDHYVVRQRDAHAWTEVYTDPTDWVVLDATPPGRFAPPAGQGLARWWTGARDLWRRWEFTWYAEVIGYNDTTRRALAAWARSHLLAAWRGIRQAAHAVLWGLIELFARGRISGAVVWFFVSVAAASGSLAALLVLLRHRRPAARKHPRPAAPKPPAFLIQLLELLRRHGLRARPSQTPRELADEAAARLGLPAEALHELISLYYRIRWSRAAASTERLREAEQQVRRLGEELSP